MKLFVLADTHLWSVPDVKGLVPEARDGHSACIVNDHMYIFSGYLEYVESYTQEVHTLNLRTMTWSYVRTTVSFYAFYDFLLSIVYLIVYILALVLVAFKFC